MKRVEGIKKTKRNENLIKYEMYCNPRDDDVDNDDDDDV